MHYYLRPEKRRYKKFYNSFTKSRFTSVAVLLVVVTVISILVIEPANIPLLAMHGRTRMRSYKAQDTIELLHSGTWNYHPGVSVAKDGVRVQYLGMTIVEQDGTNPMQNPPLNLYGTRLDVKGDFEVSATINDRVGDASITLYGRPPIILDEERIEAPSVRITIGKNIRVKTYDGEHNTIKDDMVLSDSVPQKDGIITITRSNRRIKFAIDGKAVGYVGDHKIFNNGQVWFGFDDSTPGGTWLLSSLTARGLNRGEVAASDTSKLPASSKVQNNFQDAITARSGKTIAGAAVSLEPMVSDSKYRDIAAGWYGGWTTENALKMQFAEPNRGMFVFGPADAIYDLANKNNMKMHLHTLVFGEANPPWVQELAKSDPSQLNTVMTDYIRTVASHYRDRTYSIDVVNEPLADYDDFLSGASELRKNIWFKAMGEQYIDLAFREAHAADPNALLFMNDFGLEGSTIDGDDTDRWDAFLALVDRLLARGVPIHGVGFESHIYEDGDEIVPEVFRKRINQLKERGLVFRISEVDVHAENGLKAQADQYAVLAGMCKEFGDTCVSVSTWGVSDKYGSTGYIDEDGFFVTGEGLLFDKRQEPLPAVQAFRNAL